MKVRRAALDRFGETAITRGTPLALMEEALVPVFLHHRYQVDAAASALGGQYYGYALRGDGEPARRPVPAAEQKAALEALPRRSRRRSWSCRRASSQRWRPGHPATTCTASCSRATPGCRSIR